jgi:ubiquinone/menaquinone biosynthesis C-methylase UbiE
MSFLTPRRVTSEELLDEADAPWEDLARSLRDLRRFNRYAGGIVAYATLLDRLVPDHNRRLRVLDLGTGSSDLLETATRERNIFPIGLDFKMQHLVFGRTLLDEPLPQVNADALRLPFRSDSVDVVTSSHFFHHFSPAENTGMLREALRIARVGIAINDTIRHLAPLLFVRAISALHLVGRITRNDAPASVRQGYTFGEVRQIAEQLGDIRWEVMGLPPFRFGLVVWK